MKNLIENLLSHPSLLDPNFIPHSESWQGAVCFLIIEDKVFFINRDENMPTHKGQISFVGGHKKLEERSPIETCRREFTEETGIDASHLIILKQLNAINAKSGRVVPVICLLDMTQDDFVRLVKSNGEWDEGILYPLRELSKNENWSYALSKDDALGYQINFFRLAMSKAISVGKSNAVDYCLWGASAKMILKFLGL